VGTEQPDVLVVVEQLRRPSPGGIGTYCLGLMAGLVALGDRGGPGIAVVASRPRHGDGDPVARAAGSLPVRTVPVPGVLLTRLWDVGLGAVGGAGAVVHATSLAAPPARRRQISVVTVHDVLWRTVPWAFPSRGRRWHERALRRALDQAAHLVVPSRSTADALMEAGARASSITVIEHGSDHLPEPDVGAAEALVHRLGVHGPFVLSVGTQEPRKNLARVRAAHALAAERIGGGIDLVIVGPSGWEGVEDGHHGADRRDPLGPGVPSAGDGGLATNGTEARRSPGRPVTAVTGAVDGAVLAGLYRLASVLVYVPLAEGYGLPPVEAMRLGTPVVASPMPSLSEGGPARRRDATGVGAVPGVTTSSSARDAAVVVDPMDVSAIADAMVAVVCDDDLRSDLIEAGRRRAVRGWRQVAADHLAVWSQLR
jgi:glycosyltransferase involved in cell wall biosynthesis